MWAWRRQAPSRISGGDEFRVAGGGPMGDDCVSIGSEARNWERWESRACHGQWLFGREREREATYPPSLEPVS